MFKKIFFIILCLVILGGCGGVDVMNEDEEFARVEIMGVVFDVQVVRELDEQVKGLSGREGLGEGCGMLFVYDTSEIRSFWMKDMNFALDIIFINDEVVVDVVENLPAPTEGEEPVSYEPKKECDMVLEVRAGIIEERGIRVSDRIDIMLER